MPTERNKERTRHARAQHSPRRQRTQHPSATRGVAQSSVAPGQVPRSARRQNNVARQTTPPARGEHLSRIAAVVTLVIIAALIAGVAARSCTQEPEEELEPQPFYSHSSFIRNGQFYEYTHEDLVVNKTGIDVSDHQGWIDWEAVKAEGIQFAFIRLGYRGATEGDLYLDEYFEYNIQAAHDAGIECGVYFFSQAITEDEAREEAQFVLDTLGSTKLEHPIAFDSEAAAEGITSRVAGLSVEESSAIAQVFCETIEAAGYQALLYGNGHDLGRYSTSLRESYPVWYAEYGALPAYTGEYVLWQYASAGVINGIDAQVDLNLDLSAALAAQQSSSSE